VPDDLLGAVIGPTPYSSWWLVAAVGLLFVLIAWYGAVFLMTMPGRRVRAIPLVALTRSELLKRRYGRAVRALAGRYRAGELSAAPAASAISRELRAFLHHITGARTEYMQLDDFAAGELARAVPVMTELIDAQFNADSASDVDAVSRSAEELIRSWT
jgi:hypothetical protein